MISKTEDFIRKNIAGQKTKQAQSRRKMLDKLERVDRPEDVFEAAQKLSFRFASAPRTGDIVLECKAMGATRSGRELFSKLDLLVRRGTRLAIVGPNGCGKTTLLKILADRAPAEDQGQVRRGTNLCEGYFDQNLGSLDPEKSAVEEIRSIRADMNVDTTRTYLARFRFWGDQAFQKVGGMSGGERTRLALAKLLLEPLNLLFLDEPTNHLDIPAAQILEEALQSFEGTTLFVSHDRKFLQNVSTQVLSFTDEGIELYPNGYADYVASKNRAAAPEPEEEYEIPASVRDSKRPQAISPSASAEKSSGRLSFEAAKAISRALQKKQRRLTELEELVANGEAELEALREKIRSAPGDDWEKLSEWAQEEQALSKRVDELVEEWTILGEEVARDQASIAGDSR
jgi:ATP-binding cassette subfamily F protein 3